MRIQQLDHINDCQDLGAAIADDAAKIDIFAHKDADEWLPVDWFLDRSYQSYAKCAFYGRLEYLRDCHSA